MARLFSFRIGARAERAAAKFLRRNGHIIIERNVRAGRGEIDIVSTIDGIAVLTEVRFRRGGIIDALESVGNKKRNAMISAARHYLRVERLKGSPVRIDLILMTSIDRRFQIRHLPGFCEVYGP